MTEPARALEAMQHLYDAGIPAFRAAAMVGAFQGEDFTDLKTDAVGDKALGSGHEAHGIGQWRESRWAACVAFCRAQGKDPGDLTAELDFALRELITTESHAGALLNESETLSEAVIAMLFYERPAGFDRGNPISCPPYRIRYALAKELLLEFVKTIPPRSTTK